MDKKKVVVMKTHIWSSSLEKFTHKIYNECTTVGIDFFIVMHSDDGKLLNEIESDDIRSRVMLVNKSEIKALYPSGFLSMHLSNHWLLMWFYKSHREFYDYFWTIEYDVRISGNSSIIWNTELDHDFVFVMGNYVKDTNNYNNTYTGDKLSLKEKYHGFLQISRYSNKFLEYLDQCFLNGENGQDEMIIFSMCHRGKFTMTKSLLAPLVRGKWTWQKEFSLYNLHLYEYYQANFLDKVYIFHPVKN